MRNSKKQRRIILSLLTICLTGTVLSTSTYAWFTANKTVTVSDINVNVAAANGIQVSVDGINWKTVISNDDISGAVNTYATAVNQLPTEGNSLSPVSTIGEIDTTTGFLKMFSGTIGSNELGNLTVSADRTTEANGDTGNFIAFDLFAQVTTETPVYLTSNSKVTSYGTSTGIENAARVAFLVAGRENAGTAIGTIQAIKATAGTEPVVLWEANDDAHTAAAVSNASSNYALSTATGTGNQPLAYYGVKADIPVESNILLNSHQEDYFTLMEPNISTPASGILPTAHELAFTLQPGITKIRVYMWLEGQDVDCENNASGGSVTYSVQLSSNSASE